MFKSALLMLALATALTPAAKAETKLYEPCYWQEPEDKKKELVATSECLIKKVKNEDGRRILDIKVNDHHFQVRMMTDGNAVVTVNNKDWKGWWGPDEDPDYIHLGINSMNDNTSFFVFDVNIIDQPMREMKEVFTSSIQ